MANPEAVMRAAQAGPKPMGGMPENMEGPEAAHGGPMGAPKGGDGLEGMMGSLKGVGDFLKSQGKAGEAALGHFQAMLQAMAALGQEGDQQAPQDQEQPMPGRVHESKFPGAVVL